MEDEQRQVAKEHMIALMQAGHSWREAATRAGQDLNIMLSTSSENVVLTVQ